jgi:hypothetical protein
MAALATQYEAAVGWLRQFAFDNLSAAPTPPAPNTNPSDAPYPIWSATEQYPADYKVVEHGEIYEAGSVTGHQRQRPDRQPVDPAVLHPRRADPRRVALSYAHRPVRYVPGGHAVPAGGEGHDGGA